MSHCTYCGCPVRANDGVCSTCGTPVPALSGRQRGALLVAVPVVAVLAAGAILGGVFLASHPRLAAGSPVPAAVLVGGPSAAPAPQQAQDLPTAIEPTTAGGDQAGTAPTGAAPTTDNPPPGNPAGAAPTTEDAARAALDAEVNQDRPAAEALVGSWVSQVSSKRPGLVSGGITYDYQAIWQDFAALKARYPTALLIWSGDYTSYTYRDFWITVVPTPYPDGASANSWCDGQGFAPADCYAKRLVHGGAPAANTVLRK